MNLEFNIFTFILITNIQNAFFIAIFGSVLTLTNTHL